MQELPLDLVANSALPSKPTPLPPPAGWQFGASGINPLDLALALYR